jgi:methyl-accepting chemotaxis protein
MLERFYLKHWSVRWRTQLMVVAQVGLTVVGFVVLYLGLTNISDLMSQQKRLVSAQQVVLEEQNNRFAQQRNELSAQQAAITAQAASLDLEKAVLQVYQTYPQFLFWRLASTSSLADSDIRNGNDAQANLVSTVEVIQAIDEELADAIELFLLDLDDFNTKVSQAIDAFKNEDNGRGRSLVSASQNSVISMTSMLEVVVYVADEVLLEASDAVNASLESLVLSVDAVENTGQEMTASVAEIAKSNSLTDNVVRASQNQVVILLIVIAVLSILVGLLMSHSIIAPLTRLQKRIEEIDRNTDLTLRADDQRRDDIGRIGTSVNSMLSNFKLLIDDVRKGAHDIALETDTQANSNQQVRSSLDNLNTEVDSVATAITEMTSTVVGINTITTQAAEGANSGTELCQKSSEQVSNSSTQIVGLNEKLSDASARLSQLATQTDQIYAVVDVIQGVSEQTNLLALNAAIEAARAGDQGRGFAVVADEVRTLAQRTEQSSGEIKVMVEQFAKEVNDTVVSVESAKDSAVSTKTFSDSAQDAISSLLLQMQEIQEMNMQISQSTQEQTEATSAIDGSVSRISDLLASIAEKAGSMSEAMSRLSQSTLHLEDQSNRFKT